jgi:hypothetical protein
MLDEVLPPDAALRACGSIEISIRFSFFVLRFALPYLYR